MNNNVVDSLKIKIEADTKNATDGIKKLISTLDKIKNITSGGSKGLNSIQKTLSKISKSVGKIDSGGVSKLQELTKGLKRLNDIGNIDIGKTADSIVSLGTAVNSLNNVDLSKFTELTKALKTLNRAGANTSANVSAQSSISGDVNEALSAYGKVKETVDEATNGVNQFGTSSLSAYEKVKETADEATESTSRLKQTIESTDTKHIMNVDAFVNATREVDLLEMKLTAAKDKLQGLLDKGDYDSPAVTNLVSQIKDLQSKLDETSDSTENFFTRLAAAANKAFSSIGSFAKSAFAKLTSFAAKGVSSVIKSFAKLATAPFTRLKKALSTVTAKVGELFKMFQKRALYRAINSIISAITKGFSEGTANVYQYSKAIGGTLASSLDSISTSFLYFKNSIGAAVAPLINAVAPAIEYIIDKCVDLLNVLNQVFAKLSGASTWTKAVKYPTEYAEAADSATAANKELRKSLLGIDEINALTDNSSSSGSSSGSTTDYSQMFEEVSLGNIDNPFADLLEPFLNAWANEGQNTIKAIKNAFSGIKGLVCAIGESFQEVWTNGTGQKTLETILRIFQNILNCVGNLSTALTKAWKANGNGTKIVQNLWNIFNDLLGFVEKIWGSTADWLGSLDLTPLMTALANCTAALEPLVDLIGNTLSWVYETVLLPIASWAIEKAAPASIDAITAALDALKALLQPFIDGFKQLWSSLKPIIDWVEDVVIVVINGVKSIFEKLADTFKEKGEKIQNIVSGIGDIISAIWAVVEPIFNRLKETVKNTLDFVGDIISTVVGSVIDIFSGLVDFIAGVFTGDWDRAWNGIKSIFTGLWDAIKGVVLAVYNYFKTEFDSIKTYLTNLWNGIKTFISNIWNSIKNAASSIWNGIKSVIVTVLNGIKTGIKTVLNSVKSFILTCFNSIKSIVLTVWNGIKQNIITPLSNTYTKVKEIVKYICNNPKEAFNILKDKVKEIWNSIKNTATSIWNGIKSGIINIASGIKTGIKTAFNSVKSFISTCFNSIKSTTSSIWNGIWSVIKSIINSILGGIQSMVNGVIKGFNSMINALNKLSFDVPDWVPSIGGKTFGFNIKNISEVSIPRLADGGIVNAGQMFIAQEAGPELVGNIGRRTAVMNNDQIVESVSQGVSDANSEQNALLREGIGVLRKLLDKDTNVTAYVTTGSLINGLERKNRRDGKTIVPVGV